MANNVIEEQVSMTMSIDSVGNDDNDEISSASSETDSAESRTYSFLTNLDGIIKIEDDSPEHELVQGMFLPGMGEVTTGDTEIVAVHRILNFGSSTREARWRAFQIFSEAVANSRGGNGNVRFAWYGASKKDICNIVLHGFTLNGNPASGAPFGSVCLYEEKLPMYGAAGSKEDENGLRHLLLCRVVLGNMETVPAGSDQTHPSSNQFDSGVDNLQDPRRYIIWSSVMNSHIFPFYVVSFKAPSFAAFINSAPANPVPPIRPANAPSTPWMSLGDLMSKLSRIVDPFKMNVLTEAYNDFRGRRITRAQLVCRVRVVAGDELLTALIKAYSNDPPAAHPPAAAPVGANRG